MIAKLIYYIHSLIIKMTALCNIVFGVFKIRISDIFEFRIGSVQRYFITRIFVYFLTRTTDGTRTVCYGIVTFLKRTTIGGRIAKCCAVSGPLSISCQLANRPVSYWPAKEKQNRILIKKKKTVFFRGSHLIGKV